MTTLSRLQSKQRAEMRVIPIRGRMLPPVDGKNKFGTGDSRSNMFLGLSSIHTVFLRYHNR